MVNIWIENEESYFGRACDLYEYFESELELYDGEDECMYDMVVDALEEINEYDSSALLRVHYNPMGALMVDEYRAV